MSLRVSVVITNHNYAGLVGDAIAGVRAQTRPVDELIIVDDGSVDDSLARLQPQCEGRADTRLIVQANGGQLAAMIAGTRAASGDLVCYLDADDIWEPHYVATLVDHYQGSRDVGFIYTNLRYFGDRDGLWSPRRRDHDHGITVLETAYGQRWIGAPTSALSMRREVALRALEVPAALLPDWRIRGDDVLIYGASLAAAGKRFLAEPLVRYRIHDNNQWASRVFSPARQLQYDWALRRLLAHYRQMHGIDRDALDCMKQEFRTKPAPTAGEFRLALRLAWQAPQGVGRRLERMLAIWRHYRRTRRR